MPDKSITIWILVGVAVLLIAWDVYVAFFNKEKKDTISEVVLGFARKHPVIPFIFGVIMGHLFWPQ